MHWIITGILATIVITAIIVLWLVSGAVVSLIVDFFDALVNMR